MQYARRAINSAIGSTVGMGLRGIKNAVFKRTGSRYASKKAVSSLYKKVNRIERGFDKELKTFDQTVAGTIGTTGSITCISDMAQGDTSITREGLVIQPRHLQFHYTAVTNDSNNFNFVTLIIFTDRQQNGTIPTVTELLESDSVNAFPQHDTKPRFKIHRLHRIALSTNSHVVEQQQGIIKFSKKRKIYYQGTAATAANLSKNQIYLYIVSDNNTNQPTLNFYSRLKYVDG